MSKVTLDDLCLIDTNEVREISRRHLEPDPNCPPGALYNNGNIRFDPNDRDIDRLADGDLTCARFKFWNEGSMYDDATPGLVCPEECVKPEADEEIATSVSWTKCMHEDWMVKFCAGSPIADPLLLGIDMYEQIRDCEEEKFMICILLGIYNLVVAAEAAAPGSTQILADFTVANTDGTTDISVENMAGAEGTFAITADYYITSHVLVRKLRASNFAVCCDQNGNVQRRIPELIAPGGQTIIPMDKKYHKYFDLNGDGTKFLVIGLKERSIIYKDGNVTPDSPEFRRKRPIEFNNPTDGCQDLKLYIRNRSVIHVCGYKYAAECVRCDGTRDHAHFADAANWEYAYAPDDVCGWDKSCVNFMCGTCPTTVAAATEK